MTQAIAPEKSSSPEVENVELPIHEWVEKYKAQSFFADILKVGQQEYLQPGGYSFSNCCGAHLLTPESGLQKWRPNYIHVCVRMTVEEAMTQLQITDDFVRYASVPCDGSWVTFMWEDG